MCKMSLSNLTVFFLGFHEKFSLVLLQVTNNIITSIALEKCKTECNML